MKISKKLLSIVVAISVIVGLIVSTGIRFALYLSHEVHYHANFAVFVNGQREKFEGPGYYEEIQACMSDGTTNNPKTRVHLHDSNSGLIHVHDHSVTWGNLFENLGWSVSDKTLISYNNDIYENIDPDGPFLKFWLNGKQVTSIANKVIKSEDKLLVTYGNDDDASIQKQFKQVPSDARKANSEHDPSTCTGDHELNFTQRLKKALGVN